MNRRWLILASGLLLVVTVVLLLRKPADKAQPETGNESVQPVDKADTTERARETRAIGAASNPPAVGVSAWTAAQNDPEKQKAMYAQFVEQQNVPIDFYGRVLDQDGNPISGVSVKVKVRHWYVSSVTNLNSQAQMVPLATQTGPDGAFHIHQATGDGLDIEHLQKDGYELSAKTYLHSGPSSGSPDEPVIYKMWRKGVSASLVKFDKDTRIPYDGTPVTFDLLKGAKSTGVGASGDFRVTLRREPLQRALGSKEKYDWTALIEAIGGGIVPSGDEIMYQAPEAGYEPNLQIHMSRTNADWSPIQKISFYLKSRNGECYGRATVEFITDSSRDTTGFSITSAINPAGSRNLQP